MSIDRWKDTVHIYNGILLNHTKNEIMPFAAIWMDLKVIMLFCAELLRRVWLWSSMECSPPGSSVCGDSPGKNWVDCHALLQGVSPTQGLNPGLPHYSGFFNSEPPGKPKNTGVVAYPFSRGSSWPKNWTGVSCIASEFFTNWVNKEAQRLSY